MAEADSNIVKIAFVGLPSSGKSTLINSITRKRSLQSGVARTTTEPTFICSENILGCTNFIEMPIKSDDDVELGLLDLPGVSDVENIQHGTNKNYDDLAEGWITSCDAMFWITDANTAFLTKHEKTAYERFVNVLEKNIVDTGTLYQWGIILTKFDECGGDVCEMEDIYAFITDKHVGSEYSGDEDTNMSDSLKRVKRLFPDTNIKCFNAFGRIMHTKGISRLLLSLVQRKHSGISKHNMKFNCKWLIDDYDSKRELCIVKSMCNWFTQYNNINITNQRNLPQIKLLFTRLDRILKDNERFYYIKHTLLIWYLFWGCFEEKQDYRQIKHKKYNSLIAASSLQTSTEDTFDSKITLLPKINSFIKQAKQYGENNNKTINNIYYTDSIRHMRGPNSIVQKIIRPCTLYLCEIMLGSTNELTIKMFIQCIIHSSDDNHMYVRANDSILHLTKITTSIYLMHSVAYYVINPHMTDLVTTKNPKSIFKNDTPDQQVAKHYISKYPCLKYDQSLLQQPALCANNDFIEAVREMRISIYEDEHVDVRILATLYLMGKIQTLMIPVPEYTAIL
jgi:GTPase SAR1 family protein